MFKQINIDEIKPFINNPRKITKENKDKLNNSINEFGFVDPIIIDLKDYTIIGGHQRYKILEENNIEKLFLIELGDIGWVFPEKDLKIKDENNEKGLNIALNKISGEWDKKILKDLNISLNDIFNEKEFNEKFIINFETYEDLDKWLEIIDVITKKYDEGKINNKIIRFIKEEMNDV